MAEVNTYVIDVTKNGENARVEYAITTQEKKGKLFIDVEITRFFKDGVEVSKRDTLREQFAL